MTAGVFPCYLLAQRAARIVVYVLCARLQLPDVQTGFEFREDMYEHMNTTLPTVPPRRVLLYLRQGQESRQLYKLDVLLGVMQKLKVNYT